MTSLVFLLVLTSIFYLSIDLCGQLYRCIVSINMCFISGQGWISAQCDLFDPTMMNRVHGRINLYQRVRMWRTFIQKKVKKKKKKYKHLL